MKSYYFELVTEKMGHVLVVGHVKQHDVMRLSETRHDGPDAVTVPGLSEKSETFSYQRVTESPVHTANADATSWSSRVASASAV